MVPLTSPIPVAQVREPPNVTKAHGISESRKEVLDFATPRLTVPTRVAPPTSDDIIGLVLKHFYVF